MKRLQKLLIVLAALVFILSFSIFCTIDLDPDTIAGLLSAMNGETEEDPAPPTQEAPLREEPIQEEMIVDEPAQIPETVPVQTFEPTIRPKPGWEDVSLENKHRDELIQILGYPANLVRMAAVDPANNRELWVYHPYEQDPTGLYIYLKGDVFYYSKLDEFMGFYCYDMLDPDFWELY